MEIGDSPRIASADVAIVGAALGGLVAAAILTRRGKSVVIFDAADAVGGRGGAVARADGTWVNFGHREGHDVGDVARLLALPEGTVKSRLFLARQRLKEHLQWMRNDAAAR